MAHVERRRVGRWRARYRGPDGQERSKTFTTKSDAQRFLATTEADKLRGAWVDPRCQTLPLAKVARDWLVSNPKKRPSTWARDEAILRLHVLPQLGECAIGRIKAKDVRAVVANWSQTLKPRTVRRTYGVLRAVLRFAVEEDLIVRSPCRGVKLPEVQASGRHVVTADELGTLADELGPAFAPMAYLGTVLGLRWGEVAGLRVGRLGFLTGAQQVGTVEIAEQLTRGKHGRTVLGSPKSSAGRRTLAAPAWLMDMLAAHLARRGVTGADTNAFVFVMPAGGPLDYTHWRRRVWQPACRRAGLEHLTFHDLRRANATTMVLEGVDLKTAQTRLGHSDPRLTLAVYAQATTEGDRRAADVLGAAFSRRPRPARGLAAASDKAGAAEMASDLRSRGRDGGI
jgi:integrase